MRPSSIFAGIFAVMLSGTAHAAETWEVKEGPHGQVKGIWQLERVNQTFTGTARMSWFNGATLTYTVRGTFQNGIMSFNRISPSDGKACEYRGTLKNDGSIAGSTVCGFSTSLWNARPINGNAASR